MCELVPLSEFGYGRGNRSYSRARMLVLAEGVLEGKRSSNPRVENYPMNCLSRILRICELYLEAGRVTWNCMSDKSRGAFVSRVQLFNPKVDGDLWERWLHMLLSSTGQVSTKGYSELTWSTRYFSDKPDEFDPQEALKFHNLNINRAKSCFTRDKQVEMVKCKAPKWCHDYIRRNS